MAAATWGSRLLRRRPAEPPEAEAGPRPLFAVFVPQEAEVPGEEEEALHVYESKEEALRVVRKYRKARFKSFESHPQAVAFALRGAPDDDSRNTFTGGEKPSQFKAPKPQEMVQFRKTIEAGDSEQVRKSVWENPRFLVSSGDTPSILQEGSRYNALHVAVKALNVELCNFILSTVSDTHFIQLLYSDDNIESCKDRAAILLDLYLNTPDKAMNETPLHFAVKFGAKDVVDFLVSFPQCSKTQVNKFGEQPKDIVCQRIKADASLVREISSMLQERFYVPVLHSEDDIKQPIIGEPFSPSSPPKLNVDILSPRVEIRAYAGPMNKTDAQVFRKKWKTPPRSIIINNGKTPIAAPKFRLHDVEKGLEKVGRNLAQELKIDWKEYWPFLDTFTDLTSIEGLSLFEDYLKKKFVTQWSTFIDNSFCDSLQVSPKSALEYSRNKESGSVFRSSKTSVDSSSPKLIKTPDSCLSPMSDLCLAFKSLNLVDNGKRFSSTPNRGTKTCDVHEKNINSFMNPGLSPYLCIEKACQVFAKRLEPFLLEAEYNNIDDLKAEIMRLQNTIMSYMDDLRFHVIDFNLIHSRVAHITAQKLLKNCCVIENVDIVKFYLKEVSMGNFKNVDDFSSDDEENNSPSSKQTENDHKKNNMKIQIKCLSKNILQWLSEAQTDSEIKALNTEDECIGMWANMAKCNCFCQKETFHRNCRKNLSFKRHQFKSRDGYDVLSSSPNSRIDFIRKTLYCDNELEENMTSTSINNTDSNIVTRSEVGYVSFRSNNLEDEKLYESENITYDTDGDAFFTPPSSVMSEDSDSNSDYEDADDTSDMQDIDVFIYGNKPTKTDKLVYDAICSTDIDVTKYPYVYRWRHTVGLYSCEEREGWPSDDVLQDELDSPITCSFNIGHISNFGSSTPVQKKIKNIYSISVNEKAKVKYVGSAINPISLLTPVKTNSSASKDQSFTKNIPSMQVSKWMRVTGPNSPKSALTNKSYGQNISLGFT